LATQKAVSRLAVEGGWSVVLRVPATRSDEDRAFDLLASKGISVHPGHFYELPSQGYLLASLLSPALDFSTGMAALLTTDY